MRLLKLALFCMAVGLTGCATGEVNNTFAMNSMPNADTFPAVQTRVVEAPSADRAVNPIQVASKQEANVFLPIEPAHVEVTPIKVEKVEFRLGLSSNTVEKLGERQGCKSSKGAGLITAEGPSEVYRVNCQDGSVFLARCDLRQCKPMASAQ